MTKFTSYKTIDARAPRAHWLGRNLCTATSKPWLQRLLSTAIYNVKNAGSTKINYQNIIYLYKQS